jgi:hypothetical protein
MVTLELPDEALSDLTVAAAGLAGAVGLTLTGDESDDIEAELRRQDFLEAEKQEWVDGLYQYKDPHFVTRPYLYPRKVASTLTIYRESGPIGFTYRFPALDSRKIPGGTVKGVAEDAAEAAGIPEPNFVRLEEGIISGDSQPDRPWHVHLQYGERNVPGNPELIESMTPKQLIRRLSNMGDVFANRVGDEMV